MSLKDRATTVATHTDVPTAMSLCSHNRLRVLLAAQEGNEGKWFLSGVTNEVFDVSPLQLGRVNVNDHAIFPCPDSRCSTAS